MGKSNPVPSMKRTIASDEISEEKGHFGRDFPRRSSRVAEPPAEHCEPCPPVSAARTHVSERPESD